MIYNLTEKFPQEEKFNLKIHMRSSARNTAGNIAEGFGRYFLKENLRFYGIAKGCLLEVKSDLYVSFDAGYINNATLQNHIKQTNIVKAKINGLINNVNNLIKNIKTFNQKIKAEPEKNA